MVKIKGQSGLEHEIHSYKGEHLELVYDSPLKLENVLEAVSIMLDIGAKRATINLKKPMEYSEEVKKFLKMFNIEVKQYSQ
ncbi:MAG: hypothetical protein QXQ18_01705 [Candidatus Aenigmatarchaeota archaeon]